MLWNSDRKKRDSHVKMVMQNILAGQAMLTICLVIYSEDQKAREVFEATTRLLSFSRTLMLALCDPKTKLSPHNAEEQLQVNRFYRNMYSAAQRIMPYLVVDDFNEAYRPPNGWSEFEVTFRSDPLGAVKSADLFWDHRPE